MPLFPEYEFSRKVWHQIDRIEGDIREIEVKEFNLDRLLKNGMISIGSIALNQLNLDILRDRRLPPVSGDQKLPSELLKNLDEEIKIDSINLNDSFIRFSEFVEGGHTTGIITFEKLNASLNNISTLDTDHKLPQK